ncbi:MAG: TonB-dependent receptor [Gemmatimonas sp.]
MRRNLDSMILAAVVATVTFGHVNNITAETPGHAGLVTFATRAQQGSEISGTVKDAGGRALPGARITLTELGLEVVSDAEGHYRFASVPPGRYTLVVRKIGYASPAPTVTSIASTGAHDFMLTRSARLLEPVTVTASSQPTDARLSSRSIGVLHQDALRNDASISLAHSLVSLPGVRSVSTGVQIGKPMIRGLYGARVLTLEDGMRLEDYSWSDEDAPAIDARLAQRVEVIRGPASVLYGSDALGGVVNVIPNALPSAAAGERVRRLSAEAYGASNNLEAGASARVEGANGRLGWRAAGTGRFAGSIQTPDGEVMHTGLGVVSFQGATGLRGKQSNTTLRFALVGGEFQLLEAQKPIIPTGVVDSGGPVRQLLDTRVQLVHEQIFGKLRLEAKAQWQRHSLKEVSDDCLPPIGQPVCSAAELAASKDVPAFDLLLNTESADVLLHHGTDGNIHGTFGLSGMFQSNDSRGPIFLVPDASISAVGVYALEQIRAGIFTFEGSARADHRSLNADANAQILLAANDSRSWNATTFNVGAVAQLTPMVALVANAGSGWRAPTLFDLYSNGVNIAEARYELGDPTLNREYDVNGEAGVRLTGARAHFEATGFRSNIDDFIYTSPTGQQQSGLPLFRHLQADAKFTGAEMSAGVEVATPVSVDARFDVVQATNKKTGLPLPLIPPARGAVGLTYHTERVTWLQHLALRGEVESVAKQTRLDVNDLQTGSYTLVNFAANAEHPIGARAFRFDLRVQNAGNVAYKDFLSRYKQFAQNPGFNAVFRISTGW